MSPLSQVLCAGEGESGQGHAGVRVCEPYRILAVAGTAGGARRGRDRRCEGAPLPAAPIHGDRRSRLPCGSRGAPALPPPSSPFHFLCWASGVSRPLLLCVHARCMWPGARPRQRLRPTCMSPRRLGGEGFGMAMHFILGLLRPVKLGMVAAWGCVFVAGRCCGS